MTSFLSRLFVAILSFVLLISPATLAVQTDDYDKGFYASNDILYYDPTATPCVTNPNITSSGTGTSTADENKNAEAILRYLTGKGLTLAQASGFVGNMKQESGLNPAIIQGGKTAPSNYTPVDGVGFGLVQWTFTSRQAPLVQLAKSTNRNITDMNVQLDYVWQEVSTAYKATLQALTKSSSITPTQAAIIIHGNTTGDPRLSIAPKLGYEASADSTDGIIKVRGGNAEYFYKMFKGKIADGSGVQGGTTTTSGPVITDSSNCSGDDYSPTAECSVTKPIYGEGGNGTQLRQSDLEKLYGKGGADVRPNLVNITFQGKSLQVHKKVAPCLQAVINDIEKKDIKYTIKLIGGYRGEKGGGNIDLADGYHFYGAAIDINPEENRFYQGNGSHPYDMPKEYVDIFRAHGWSWGGNWNSVKDYMHFEFNGLSVEGGGN